MEIIPSPFLCFITLSFLVSHIQASSSGFSVELIHRDSQLSPYYNSSNTYYENLSNSLRRAKTRSSHIFTPKLPSPLPTVQSPLKPEGGEYLMKFSVGTPPLDLLAVVDTGSDLTWIQCKPCTQCYKQNSPLFDPKKSSTYRKQPCRSKTCRYLQPPFCDDKNFCKYAISNSYSSAFSTGDLSLESFAFESTSGKPVIVPKFSFGCGHINSGRFDTLTDGVVGLGNGDLSIVNQLSDTINAKFSYCMVPLKLTSVSSKISFGSHAVMSGPRVQKTPLFTKNQDKFYYLNFESITIGDTNLKFETKKHTNNANDNDGNIIIDSGSIATCFPSEFYQRIEDEFKKIIPSTPVETEQEVLRLCYKNEEGFEEKVPSIAFHFTGADWELGALNTILGMDDGTSCFSIAPGSEAIFGNLQQMNYLVGYDLNSKISSFKKTDCTKY